MKGTYARDKDAVVATMLIVEMTAYYRSKGMTLSDALDALYARYGFSAERNLEVNMDGLDGAERMAALMRDLRENAPCDFAGVGVVTVGDYEKETFTDMASGKETPTGLPKSNVLYYVLDGGDTIVVRPSGTEPKVKFYFLVSGETDDEAMRKIDAYKKAVMDRIG